MPKKGKKSEIRTSLALRGDVLDNFKKLKDVLESQVDTSARGDLTNPQAVRMIINRYAQEAGSAQVLNLVRSYLSENYPDVLKELQKEAFPEQGG